MDRMPDCKQMDRMPAKVYPRYGGLAQFRPLSAEEKEYDDTCRAIDIAQEKLLDKPASAFTARDLLWLAWLNGVRFSFPRQDQLSEHLLQVGNLLKRIEEREEVKP